MSALRIIPLGGMGNVTKNMFVYEYGQDMLIVDCGIGFPEINMHGIDLLIPDATYVHKQIEQGKKVVGMVFTHGHDDHIAAAGYILPGIEGDFPIFASPLTAAFAEQRLLDHHVETGITVLPVHKIVELGPFKIELITVTHSVPDTRHVAIHTPEGIIYHGSDFKLDEHPVDGEVTDFKRIDELAEEGILCALIDCLRIENSTRNISESTVIKAFEREMADVTGKVIVTLMSSHIHRIQQAVDVAVKQGRKICFIGRSVEQNIDDALTLKKLKLDRQDVIDKRDMNDYDDNRLCLIIAGSQGQEGSSLIRAIFGEHQQVRITTRDKVIFSADVIPGNEQPFYNAIDELAKNGIDVVYPDIAHDLHVSGHASAPEQKEIIEHLKPKYLFPVGGAYRHRKLFHDMVRDMGYKEEQVVQPDHGEVVSFENQQYRTGETLTLRELMVDGKGIGDVGTIVLSDRRTMSEDGMIVIVVPKFSGSFDLSNIQVISRGFIYMRDGDEFIQEIRLRTAEIIQELQDKGEKEEEIRRKIERRVGRRLDKMIGRTPLILPVFMEMER